MEADENAKKSIISVTGFSGSGNIYVSEWIAENIVTPLAPEIIYIKNLPHDERKLNAMGNNISKIEKEGKITVINIGPRTSYTVDSTEANLTEILQSYSAKNRLFVLDGFQDIPAGNYRIFRILVVRNIREIDHFSSSFTPDLVVLNGESAIHDESIIKWPDGKQSILYAIMSHFINPINQINTQIKREQILDKGMQTRENIL
jgi:molybdopterin-guanine dinucleotide biosynthesis protein